MSGCERRGNCFFLSEKTEFYVWIVFFPPLHNIINMSRSTISAGSGLSSLLYSI